MPNVGGSRQNRRALLASVTATLLLYGAIVWVDALRVESYRKKTAMVYRLSVLMVTSAFRNVSGYTVCVLAGMPPHCFIGD